MSTSPPMHILVKTVSQVTIPARMLAIVPATFNSIPKPDFNYNIIEMSVLYTSQQTIFVVSLLKFFGAKLPVCLLCTMINTSLDDVILPKLTYLGNETAQ